MCERERERDSALLYIYVYIYTDSESFLRYFPDATNAHFLPQFTNHRLICHHQQHTHTLTLRYSLLSLAGKSQATQAATGSNPAPLCPSQEASAAKTAYDTAPARRSQQTA